MIFRYLLLSLTWLRKMWHDDHSTPTDTPPSSWLYSSFCFCFLTEYSAWCWDLPLAAVRWWLAPGSLRTRVQSTRGSGVTSRGHWREIPRVPGIMMINAEILYTLFKMYPDFSLMTIFPQYFLSARWQAGPSARTGASCQHWPGGLPTFQTESAARIAATIIRNYGSQHLRAHVCMRWIHNMDTSYICSFSKNHIDMIKNIKFKG